MNVTTASFLFIYTKEAMAEVKAHVNSKTAYLNPKGGFMNSPMVDTVKRSLIGLMRRS